ncbi:MAG: MipA/OmpV family protein [Fusobacterium sp.]|uniref:MipA/OmpV family protein n=1 Tax=Fusobacterium sp. TaxID=68766 RepID=UPI00399AAE22
MKKIILTLTALAICSTATLAQENKFSVGMGVGTTNHFYHGDEITFPTPFFDVRYDNFFITGANIGYDVFNEDSITLSLFVNPFDGFPIKASKMDHDYDSIDERKTQIALGAIAAYDLPAYDMTALVSFSGGERGVKAGASLVKPYNFGSFTLIPSVSATFYSEDYTDYYFGIDSDERGGKIRDTYSPNSAYSLGINLAAEYYLTEKITLLAFLSADKFSSEVGDSPIIDNSTLLKMGVGAKYSF